MLDTEQNKFIIAVWILRICYYATYLWQIDDEPSTRKRMTCIGMSIGEIETGQDTVAIGYLGEGE